MGSSLLVWRVRLWLAAVAVVLMAGHRHGPDPELATKASHSAQMVAVATAAASAPRR
jgi:hypothetical protein